ncbi:MAG: twitch domain-containing radical SAM protein [Flavobacteriales bacterium]|nr:twitch domain-containing radical SAM protein [Flavobacteriales bacterium]
MRTILERLNNMFVDRGEKPLCLYPFMNVLLTADGRYKPCCRWSETLTHNGAELSVSNGHTLKDAWASTEMESLRADMLQRRKNKKCSVCWSEDQSGIRSMRFDSFNYGYRKPKSGEEETPLRLDIYPSNKCNLRCRICSHNYSTGWIKEAKESLNQEGTVHENLTQDNLAQIDQWLANIKEIGLFGGEPLYTTDCHELMRSMIDKGYSKNITLLINTNGTIYSSELIEMFRKFKKVILNFSIDDIGSRFEYQRKGAKWSDVSQNLKQYLNHSGIEHSSQIESKICCTVSAFNAYYLQDLFNWVSEKLHPNMKVYLNVLHGPMALSLRNLPEPLKKTIAKQLSGVKKNAPFDSEQYRSIDNIVDFMKLPPEIDTGSFINEVERGDRYRKERFSAVFAEIADALAEPNVNG